MTGEARPEPLGLALLRRTVVVLGKVEIVVAVAALASATVIGVAQIALRYASGRSFWWAQEVSILLMLVAYFVGGSIVYRLRYDVVVSFLVDRAPLALRHPAYLVVQAIALLFWVTLAWQLYRMLPVGMKTYTAIMRIPKIYAMLPLFYASLSISLLTVYIILARLHAGWRAPVASLDDLDETIRNRLGKEVYT